MVKGPSEAVLDFGFSDHSQASFEKLVLEDAGPWRSNSSPKVAQEHLLPLPQELRPDRTTRRLATAYDSFLIAIPVILIAKIVLCIVASRIDRWHQNVDLDAVSMLTISLVKFNGQVSSFVSATLRLWLKLRISSLQPSQLPSSRL